jgi:glycosyltransferase involved in cell wall biosynthesis
MAVAKRTARSAAAHDMAKSVRVSCLPIAGTANPYQALMMEGLRQGGVAHVEHGRAGRILAALRTCILQRPDFLHYDWNYSYFLTRSGIVTAVLGCALLIELWIVRHLFRCRVVWTFHNIESHEAPHPKLERWVQRRFARQCEWIRMMYRSSVAKAVEYLGVSPDRMAIVPMGAYHGVYPNNVSNADARRTLGLNQEDRVLLNLGSMRGYKGIVELLETARAINDPRFRLIVAGPCSSPQLATQLRDLAKLDPRVSLLIGYVQDNRLQILINASDAFILPFSRVENSSSVLLAMTFAKPVIAPVVGVLPEQLSQQAELLYPDGGLKEAIAQFLSMDVELLQRAGRRNYTVALGFDWADFAALFVERASASRVRRHYEAGTATS